MKQHLDHEPRHLAAMVEKSVRDAPANGSIFYSRSGPLVARSQFDCMKKSMI